MLETIGPELGKVDVTKTRECHNRCWDVEFMSNGGDHDEPIVSFVLIQSNLLSIYRIKSTTMF